MVLLSIITILVTLSIISLTGIGIYTFDSYMRKRGGRK